MNFSVVASDLIFTVDNFFTPEECLQHIELSEDKQLAPLAGAYFFHVISRSPKN